MLAALLLALFLAAGAPARDEGGWQATPAELEAYHHYDSRRFIKAREVAERVVKENPRSFQGLFVLGLVEHYAEGNLSRALRLLARARAAFEARFGASPEAGTPWRWHAEVLKELAWVSGEMDRRAEELVYLDAHDAVYSPPLLAERAWPLMKLGRLAEARAVIQQAIATGQRDQVDRALTARCAIEYEAQNRQGAFDACSASAEAERRDPRPGSIPFGNAAEAAMGVLRFDLAERLILEATRMRAQGADNPWASLSNLYVAEGRFAEAGEVLKKAIAFRRARPPYLDQQMRAETEAAAATFLVAAGQYEAALRFTRRAVERPDRGGLKSGQPEIAQAGAAMVHHAAALGAAELLAERASAAPLVERVTLGARAARLRVEAFRHGRRAVTLLASRDRLAATLRPYLGGGALVAAFLAPDLVRLVGPGVAETALEHARRREELAEARPYLDELAAEAALARGRYAEALALAGEALGRMPGAEKLLEARAAAVAAEAARELGRDADAATYLDRALQRDPGVLRRLGVRLPVRVATDGSATALRAAALLDRSPRLELRASAPFSARLGGGEACLLGSSGAVLACARPPRGAVRPDTPPDAAARALVDAFHGELFAPRVDLAQLDISSLDGSTATAGGAAADQVKILLRDLD